MVSAQFLSYDPEQEELQANFLHRTSSNTKWFVWPQFELNGKEDRAWVPEEAIFYRLSAPTEGRRMTLQFENIEDVEKQFQLINKQ